MTAGASKVAPRRPKFDKVASTTVLLAALAGLGAGATWQLVRAAAPPRRDLAQSEAATQTQTLIVVVDANGRVVATLDATNAARQQDATFTLSRGRAGAPVAATRAS